MAFYVGQKVAVINNDPSPYGDAEHIDMPIGSVWTVAKVFTLNAKFSRYHGYTMLVLVEKPSNWLIAEDFRPVVERKTDISIFTAMLTPKRQSVDA